MKFRIKNIVFLLFLFLVSLIGFSQNTYVPDDNFEQALIDLGYDVGPLNDFVPTANIESITFLIMQNKGIIDLTGIEDFTSLESFNCTDNLIETLDLSSNINLKVLNADRNQITDVNVSQNALLESFYIGENLLTSIDVSQNIQLKYFFCSLNQITSLNIENNINLINLSCFHNELTTFTIPPVNSLEDLEISNNLLTSLNLLNGNSLKSVACLDNQLSDLDVSSCLNLEIVLFSNNNISSIDLSNNIYLYAIWCENNPLAELELSQNPDLGDLIFGQNRFINLDLSNNSRLYRLIGSNNEYLCNIDLRNGANPSIIVFSVTDNPQLTCIFVNDTNYSNTNWLQIDPNTMFVLNESECNNLPCNIQVDSLNDVTANESYVLPILLNGNYFTGPDGSGTNLNPGDTIFTSQKIYIYNENICNPTCNKESSFDVIISQTITDDFFIPKFFTPNNDGYKDTWQIYGVRNFNEAKIFIYDRYGKLLKQLSPTGLGWDGTFNGQVLGTNDFWFTLDLGNGKTFKGHFTLKR